MSDPIRSFEITILRPIFVIALVGAGTMLWRGEWWSMALCLLLLFCVGAIGSQLHPFQTASEMSEGPLTGRAGTQESTLFSDGQKKYILGRACTRVAVVLSVSLFLILVQSIGWR